MPATIKGMADVRHRFSHADAAGKWNAMYADETERLDECNFRLRRDFTVAQVLSIVTPDSQVLDLGCGAGPVVSELRQRGVKVVGIDYSEDMLEHARARLRSQGLTDDWLFQGDCRNTAFQDESFDVIVCLGVISYIENYDPALAEIKRLLKPGGTVILSFRNVFNPVCSDPVALLRYVARSALQPVLGPRPAEPFEIGRFLDYRVVNRKMDGLGFKCLDFAGIGFGPFRIAGKRLLDERQSISLSRGLARCFEFLHMRRPLRWLTDVSLWVYQKPMGSHGS